MAWLEPEQTTSCHGFASASSCGTPGIGTVASRMQVRRFPLDNVDDLRVGDHVVVGVGDRALIQASLTAYALPGDRDHFLAAGLDGYIGKPVQPDDLAQALAEIRLRTKTQ